MLSACYILYFVRINRLQSDAAAISEYYERREEDEEAEDEPDLPPEEDLTVIRKPEDTPPYTEYEGPDPKIYPDL